MKITETDISLDVLRLQSQGSLQVMLGDTARRIRFFLHEQGEPYELSSEVTAVLGAKKPDGTCLFQHCSVESGQIYYDFDPQFAAAVGTVFCELRLYGEDGKLLTSPRFSVMVTDTVYHEGDEIESSSEFSALTKLIEETQDIRRQWDSLIDSGVFDSMGSALLHKFDTALQEFRDTNLVGLPVIYPNGKGEVGMMHILGSADEGDYFWIPDFDTMLELIKLGFIDVTADFEKAKEKQELSEPEFLWTLGPGNYVLRKGSWEEPDGFLYFRAFRGEMGQVRGRLLYDCGEFCHVSLYLGNVPGGHEAVPDLYIDGEEGRIWRRGQELGASTSSQAPVQEYVSSQKLNLWDKIQRGCYLLSTTGQPSNKTEAMVDAGYVLLPVEPGEQYLVTTYVPGTSGILFYDQEGKLAHFDNGGKEGGNVRISKYPVTVPEGCVIMGVSTRRRTTDPITLWKQEPHPMGPQNVGEALELQERLCEEHTDNEDDRLYALEAQTEVNFRGLERGKVIFMTDGTRSILSDVYGIFRNHGMVMSVAPVYSGVVTNPKALNDNSTPLEFLHQVQEDGGEIFAHSMNGDALTPETAEEMLRESKRWLTEEGFEIHGWIAPRGIFCPEAGRLYHKYYRYGYRASDRVGSLLNFERPYLSELGLEGAKAAVDACERDKTVIVLFHHWSDNELEGFNTADLEALLSYIESKNVDVTTYRDCFFHYATGTPEKGLTEEQVLQLIDEAFGGLLNEKY